MDNPSPQFRGSDEEWFQRIVRSLSDPSLGLPGFPPPERQQIFVGRSGEEAMRRAYDFYRYIKSSSKPITERTRILDFGVGWGRIIRFFIKDVPPTGLFGVDVDREVLAECKSCGVPGKLEHIEPLAALPFPSDYFDIIYAFSVFSHLSTQSATFWLNELLRVCKPSGAIFLTTMTDQFIRDANVVFNSPIFVDPEKSIKSYQRGEHVYAPVGGHAAELKASNYGWAAMPPEFVKAQVGSQCEVEFLGDVSRFEQAVFILRKNSSSHTVSESPVAPSLPAERLLFRRVMSRLLRPFPRVRYGLKSIGRLLLGG